MPNIDSDRIIQEMSNAFSKVLKNEWLDIKSYAEVEFRNFINTIINIQQMKDRGEISEERAKQHIEMQNSSMRAVLLAENIIGSVAIEQAINAAIGEVRNTINRAIGWNIL